MHKIVANKKILIFLKNSQEIHAYLSSNDTNALIDQVYSVFSGEFDDNCIEIVSNNELGKETILLKADEILYIKTQEDVSNE
jgi:uncharacterized protein YeeX (DUF496 family)